ncbi:MAG: BatA domain-containing protein [Fulvivirga sp.]
MTFLSPLYLYGLFGLLVPIAIHIWSKKEGRLIKVGSTQFFPEAESKQSSSLHINEIWLLILRLLLITTLVLILAKPMIQTNGGEGEKIALITPGIEDNPQVVGLRDSLAEDGYNFKWLAAGFPDFDTEIDTDNPTHYWQLLDDLKELESQNVVVICDLKFKDIVGKRPILPFNPAVIYVENESSHTFLADAQPVDRSSFKIIKGLATQQSITFDEELVAAGQVFIEEGELSVSGLEGSATLIKDTIGIKFKADGTYSNDVFFIKEAIRSIQTYTKWPLKFIEDGEADWLIWLSEEKVDVDANNVLTLSLNETKRDLIAYNVFNENYELTQRLTEDIVIEEKLAIRLLKILREKHFNQPQQAIDTYDVRQIDEQQISAKTNAIENEAVTRQAASSYLWWLLLLLFIGERLLSAFRKQ